MTQQMFDLTLEQKFQLRALDQRINNLTAEQLKELLLQTAARVMVKDNIIRELLRSAANGNHSD